MKKIPLDDFKGKTCEILIRRGLGNKNECVKRHRGILLDFSHHDITLQSFYGDRKLRLRRPCYPRDSVIEIKEK